MTGKLRIGIYGASGYVAGELIRILIGHPNAEIVCAQSESQPGKPIEEVHTDLIGQADMAFQKELGLEGADALFLCKGHGESKSFLESAKLPPSLKLIDLSNDFRLKADANGFVYGLPEVNRERIKSAGRVANPGCFATCIQLGLLPAATAGMIASEVHTSAITGSTGAGQKLSPTSHFSWRNNNMGVYKALAHQHLGEIEETLGLVAGKNIKVNFIPYRGNFTRGIIASSYFDCGYSIEKAYGIYENFYAGHPFVHVAKKTPDLKMVTGTNKAVVYLQKEKEKIIAISVIDNLLKGASGQAAHNMNLMFGLDEKTGLNLKPIGF